MKKLLTIITVCLLVALMGTLLTACDKANNDSADAVDIDQAKSRLSAAGYTVIIADKDEIDEINRHLALNDATLQV